MPRDTHHQTRPLNAVRHERWALALATTLQAGSGADENGTRPESHTLWTAGFNAMEPGRGRLDTHQDAAWRPIHKKNSGDHPARLSSANSPIAHHFMPMIAPAIVPWGLVHRAVGSSWDKTNPTARYTKTPKPKHRKGFGQKMSQKIDRAMGFFSSCRGVRLSRDSTVPWGLVVPAFDRAVRVSCPAIEPCCGVRSVDVSARYVTV